jgi:hypothetical protein
MKTVYTNRAHLLGHGPNQSFGNHMLHLFYIWNLSKQRGFNMGITANSNLDELLILDKYKKKLPPNSVCLYDELHGGEFDEFYRKESQNLNVLYDFLFKENLVFPDNFYLKGWFWHEKVSPSSEIFEDLQFKPEILNYVKTKYPFIFDDSTLTIHYRGTDFKRHSIGWGDLSLPEDYYVNALNSARQHMEIKKILVVSDEPSFITDILTDEKKIITYSNENYYTDWLILHQSKNLICSNSSFCWTAGLFNKNFVTQPKGFFMYNINKEKVFPPNPYYKNSKII